MKVQIFPKPVHPGCRCVRVCFVCVGALTLKPSAYVARPWETTGVEVFNHLEGVGSLFFHLRGGRVVRVTAVAAGWLTDRARFSYDGYRRQRLVTPLVRGVPTSWPAAVTRWWDYLVGANRFDFNVDSATGVYFFWLFRVYSAVTDRRGRLVRVSLDGAVDGAHVYHGAFGLPGVTRAELALPACLPHEEEGHLRHPTGGTLLFGFAAAAFQLATAAVPYRSGWFGCPGDTLPRRFGAALLQVSPLQRVLGGW